MELSASPDAGAPADTIYFGGGTPTVLGDELVRLEVDGGINETTAPSMRRSGREFALCPSCPLRKGASKWNYPRYVFDTITYT